MKNGPIRGSMALMCQIHLLVLALYQSFAYLFPDFLFSLLIYLFPYLIMSLRIGPVLFQPGNCIRQSNPGFSRLYLFCIVVYFVTDACLLLLVKIQFLG